MDTIKLLCDSKLCRLCAAENNNGTLLFTDGDNGENLSSLVNKYLPLKVENDFKFPRFVCPGCEIQLEATKLFFDLIVEGQTELREIYQHQREFLKKQESQRQKLQDALQNLNPTSSVGTYEIIHSDEDGEKYFIQIITDGPLFPPEHEMALRANGLSKPKRKRGRPPKLLSDQHEKPDGDATEIGETITETPEINSTGKRKRKVPTRFKEAIQGKELDKILKEEGVVDEESLSDEEQTRTDIDVRIQSDEVIGRMEGKDGEDLGKLIVISKNAHKTRLKKSDLNGNKRRRKYRCEKCSKEFRNYARFELHGKSHSRPIPASQQLKEIENLDTQTNDVQSKSLEAIDIETQNDLSPSSNGILQENFKATENSDIIVGDPTLSQAPKESFNCEKCSKTFNRKQNYEIHTRAVHNKEQPFKCNDCHASFSYANSLKVHQLKHRRGIYTCEVCQKKFNHPSSLIYHRNAEHNNGRRFVCNKCNKGFKHRQLLQRHQMVHSDERPHKCGQCPAAFKTRANLVNHGAVHSGEKNYSCAQCGHAFAHKTSLNLHMRWHQGEKPYTCDICSKKFSQKGNLVEHKRIHTGEKPYTCEHCDRSFTTSSQFRLHSKRHTGERPWRCEHCGKTFLHKDTWKYHIRRHTNDRPYKCSICQRGFTESYALKKHERLHSGEKPFICNICNRGFADSSNLTKHKRIHSAKILKHMKIANQLSKNDLVYVYYQKTNGQEQTSVHFVEHEAQTEPEPEIDPVTVEDEQVEVNEEPLHIQHLIDQEGNPFNLSTQDGQQIKVVASIENGQEKIQGLLPDGSLVTINLEEIKLDNAPKMIESEEITSADVAQLLDSDLEFTNESSQKLDNSMMLTDNQNVCFVTYNVADCV